MRESVQLTRKELTEFLLATDNNNIMKAITNNFQNVSNEVLKHCPENWRDIVENDAYFETMKFLLYSIIFNKPDPKTYQIKLGSKYDLFKTSVLMTFGIFCEKNILFESIRFRMVDVDGVYVNQMEIIMPGYKDAFVYIEQSPDSDDVYIYTNIAVNQGSFIFKKIIII